MLGVHVLRSQFSSETRRFFFLSTAKSSFNMGFIQVKACPYQKALLATKVCLQWGFIFKLIQGGRHLSWSSFSFLRLKNTIFAVQINPPLLNRYECFIYCLIYPVCVYLNQSYACYVNNYPRNYHRFHNGLSDSSRT